MKNEPDLSGTQVSDWLRAHPEFFGQHPDLLPAAINASGKVLSLEAGQLRQLRRMNDEMRDNLEAMLSRIRRNEEIYHVFHAIQTRMILADDPRDLIVSTTRDLEKSLDLHRVTVTLSDREGALCALLGEATAAGSNPAGKVTLLDHAQLTKILGRTGLPVIRIGQEGGNRHLFFGSCHDNIRSEALVPLFSEPLSAQGGGGRLVGSLNLGSGIPNRFLPNDSSDLVRHLADVLGVCLMRMERGEQVALKKLA